MRITRRDMLKATAGFGMAAGLGTLGPRAARAGYTMDQIDKAMAGMKGRKLVIATWGGTYQDALREAWFKPFMERYGVEIIEDGPPLNPKIIAQVESGNVLWDICDFASYKVDPLGLSGHLTELDYSIIDPAPIYDRLVTKWGIASCIWTTILAYRTDTIGAEPPTSIAALWDLKKYPGKRALHDNPIHNLPFALIASGVPKEKVYPLTPEKIDQAFAKLDEIKDEVIWWSVGAESPQLLANKEVILAEAYHGRLDELIAGGLPIKIVWEGSQMSADSFVIPKGAKNQDVATLFIAYTLLAENNWKLSNYISYGPSNREAASLVKDSIKPKLPTAYLDQQLICDNAWWGPQYDKLVERWSEWKLKA